MKAARIKQFQEEFSRVTVLRSGELEQHGFSRPQIREAMASHVIERLGRGLYALPNTEHGEHQSLLHVAKSVPIARICLLSALRFHNLTTQNPHEVWIAIGRKDRRPSLTYPPLRVQRFSGPALNEGLEERVVNGVLLRVYSISKTVVDLFRYRNKIGIDVAIEALKEGWKEKRFTMKEIDRLAGLCRMKHVMGPYLESLVS